VYGDPLLDGLDEWIASQKSLTSHCVCFQKAWIEPMHILYFMLIQNPRSIDDYRECTSVLGAVVYGDPLLDGLDEWIASQKSLTSHCVCFQKAWIEPMHILYFMLIQNPRSIDDYRECASVLGVVVYGDPLLDGLDEWVTSRKSLTSHCICFQKAWIELMHILDFILIQNP
jgi:hypothetical protein